MTPQEQARALEMLLILEALWEAGKSMLLAYAKDMSGSMPPLPDWSELPPAAQIAFAMQSTDIGSDLMRLVEAVATGQAQIDLGE